LAILQEAILVKNIRATARKYKVSDGSIRYWNDHCFEMMAKGNYRPTAKTTHSGPSVHYPEMEEMVSNWINYLRDEDITVQTKIILEKAFSIAKSDGIKFLKNSKYCLVLFVIFVIILFIFFSLFSYVTAKDKRQAKAWLYRFLEHHNFSIRCLTRVGQSQVTFWKLSVRIMFERLMRSFYRMVYMN
jgi:hypothetical protein